MENEDALKGAIEHWKQSKIDHQEIRVELIEILKDKSQRLTLTELEVTTGIKRTTLYYMIYGRNGKGGNDSNQTRPE